MTKEDLDVYRTNVTTIIKGTRPNKKEALEKGVSLEKNERKFGPFTLSFRIPNNYERKWTQWDVENGVFWIQYKNDNDECELDAEKKEEKKEGGENMEAKS